MTVGLAIRGLGVRFAGQAAPALDGIDLTFPAGSFTVLVGPSGCGKSTLLNCLAGLVLPTWGTVSADGVPVTGPDPRRGVVFQRDILFPWTTVRGNLDFALRARKVPRDRRPARIRELLAAVHLDDQIRDRKPNELSGGMRQRVGIARMLAGDPDVMLMDEPFAALDAQTRLNMQDLVTEIWATSKPTIVFVTHDVDEAIRLADHIVVMAAGGIRECLDSPLARPRPGHRLADLDGYSELRRHLHEQLMTVPPDRPTAVPAHPTGGQS